MKINDLHKEIFEWMNTNPTKVIDMTINELAKELYTTPSTITKSLKDYGYSGFKDFKAIISSHSRSANANAILGNSLTKISTFVVEPEFISSIKKLEALISSSEQIYIMGKGYSQMIGLFLGRIISNNYGKTVIFVEDLFTLKKNDNKQLIIAISLDLQTEFISKVSKLKHFPEFESILITKQNPKYSLIKPDLFKGVIRIPNEHSHLDNSEFPIVSKLVFELAIASLLKGVN